MIDPNPLNLYLESIGKLVPDAGNTVYQLPLQQFAAGTTDQLVNVSINTDSYIFYFQNNIIENNLFLSVFGANQTPIYFGSYRCVFGSYINLVDAGLPYLVHFLDSTNNNYTNITFDNLNNGVQLFVTVR